MTRHVHALRAGEVMLAACSGLTLFGMMVLGIVDVVSRYAFNSPVPGAAEVLELAVELLGWPPGTFLGRLQNSATSFLSAAIVAVIAWQVFVTGSDFASYGDTSSYLGIPLAPIAWFMSAMAGISFLTLCVQIVTAWRAQPSAQVEDMGSIERGIT
jgi:uncharacterized protein YeaC (DUF1315 family)